MRKLYGALATVASITFLVIISPIAWALRDDKRERDRAEALRNSGEWYPYYDNDPGVDVDEITEEERTP